MDSDQGRFKERIVKLLAGATKALTRGTSDRGSKEIVPEDEPVVPLYYTEKGNPLETISQSAWYMDAWGVFESRTFLGRSIEGFHGGLELSRQGGEGQVRWSEAHPDAEKALDAAYGMAAAWENRHRATEESVPEPSATPAAPEEETLPFRFRKPWAHLEHYMTGSEHQTLAVVEARWREDYELSRRMTAPPEGQKEPPSTADAVDHLNEALRTRERGRIADWKLQEAEVEKAFFNVRKAFSLQRNEVEKEQERAARSQCESPARHRKNTGPDRGR